MIDAISGSQYAAQIAGLTERRAEQAKAAASKDFSGSSDEELMDVCKQFESYFIEQVLKEVKKTVPDTAFAQDASNKSMVDFFMDSTIQKVSENLQEKAGLGLAQQMFDQMKRNYAPKEIPAAKGAETAVEETKDTAGPENEA